MFAEILLSLVLLVSFKALLRILINFHIADQFYHEEPFLSALPVSFCVWDMVLT